MCVYVLLSSIASSLALLLAYLASSFLTPSSSAPFYTITPTSHQSPSSNPLYSHFFILFSILTASSFLFSFMYVSNL